MYGLAALIAVIGFALSVLAGACFALANVRARQKAVWEDANGSGQSNVPASLNKGSIMTIYIVGAVCDAVSLRLAPLALVGAASAFGIPFTAMLTSERFDGSHKRGAALVFLALVLVPMLGPHFVDDTFGIDQVEILIRSSVPCLFVLVNAICIVVLGSLVFYWHDERTAGQDVHIAVADVERKRSILPYVVRVDVCAWAFLASDTAAWVILLVKINISCLINIRSVEQAAKFLPVFLTLVIGVYILPRMVMKSTGRFPSAVFIPVFQTTTMLLTTVHGGVFMGEFQNFDFSSPRGIFYIGAFALAAFGIRSSQGSDTNVSLPGGNDSLLAYMTPTGSIASSSFSMSKHSPKTSIDM